MIVKISDFMLWQRVLLCYYERRESMKDREEVLEIVRQLNIIDDTWYV